MALTDNKIKIQSLIDEINALPEAITLDELTNPGSAATMLEGTEMLDGEGKKVTGTIETKTSSNLTASGATVSIPAGYYAANVSKSVTTASRANTTITTAADDTNDTLTFTASNDQTTGYVTGSNKTATKTVTLTADGATVTASDGSASVSKSVQTGYFDGNIITVNNNGLITATTYMSQSGYVNLADAPSNTKQLPTQAAKTITPSTSAQTAVASGVYTTGAVTVAATPLESVEVYPLVHDIQTITPSEGCIGFSEVISHPPTLIPLTIAPSVGGEIIPSPPDGVHGFSSITVEAVPLESVDVYPHPTDIQTITPSGEYIGFSEIISHPPTIIPFTVTPRKEEQILNPEGVDGFKPLTVEAIPDRYEDITEPLAELNATNGGTAALTMAAAVDNTTTLTGAQTTLIAQIQTALEGKTGGGGGEDVSAETAEYTGLLDDLETAIDALPEAGGGGSVESCSVLLITGGDIYDISYTPTDDAIGFIPGAETVDQMEYTINNVTKNTVMTINFSDSWSMECENAVLLGRSYTWGSMTLYSFRITGNATITAS